MISQTLKDDSEMFGVFFLAFGIDENINDKDHNEFIEALTPPQAGSASLEGSVPPVERGPPRSRAEHPLGWGPLHSRAPTRAFPAPPHAPIPARAYGNLML
jgi:hypothetical protein